MALLGLLVLLALAWPVGATWDSCRSVVPDSGRGLRGTQGVPGQNRGDRCPLGFCGPDTSDVEDGTSGEAGAWPGIVSIQATAENGTWHMCTGVLFSAQWVLTVAHCFFRVGSQHHVPLPFRHIKRLLVHQHYVPTTARNDIALLELDQPVECSDYIQLGCLCNSSPWYAGAVHSDNLCAGYPHGGIDTCQVGACDVSLSRSLSHVPLSPRPGPALLEQPPTAPEPSLLAQGDSGSPLVCKDNGADFFWLVGMYSWGRGCDRARHPGIYTSTQHFYNWILLQTGLSPAERAGPAPEPATTSEQLWLLLDPWQCPKPGWIAWSSLG
uniref:Peptidase S1 domain-containing protein n=1 Tax=Catharus ustulatus TaxID=91951 RepID=A0A8C3Y3G9_CATUS